MKIRPIYFIAALLSLIMTSCGKDPASSPDSTKAAYKDRFLLPSLPDDYQPKGLRKLSILEMKRMVEAEGISGDIVWKDQRGNTVAPDYYGNGPDARYVQFYANSAGKVEEAVVYEMTPEIKAVMMLMRVATLPAEY